MKIKLDKNIVEISRILLGIVFVFSGFVKAIDPWGSAYKILDYLVAFGLRSISFLDLFLSFALSAVEFGIGICLLLGVYRKNTTLLALIFMAIMTPLTLYLAIANPVTDCGCFGDALVLSNWATFFKNLVLLAAAIALINGYKLLTRFFSRKFNVVVMLWVYIFILGVSFFCYSYLPILDFRPYKIGVNIPRKMKMPENAEKPDYKTTLIYSKNGIKKEFTLEDYPKNDSTWVFVDSKSKLIKKGYELPIHDFTITTEDGEDITEHILTNPSYTFLLIAHKLDDASDTNISEINDIYDYSRIHGYEFYALTASLKGDIEEWISFTGAEYPFCTTDDITLKTIIRSNPGLLLLKNGTILNKWPGKSLPQNLGKPIDKSSLGEIASNRGMFKVLLLMIFLWVPLAFLYLYDKFYAKKIQQNKKKREKRRTENRYLKAILKKRETDYQNELNNIKEKK
jgi:uncharacterized membrane protein YphA (DoxX/SURF4 family)